MLGLLMRAQLLRLRRFSTLFRESVGEKLETERRMSRLAVWLLLDGGASAEAGGMLEEGVGTRTWY